MPQVKWRVMHGMMDNTTVLAAFLAEKSDLTHEEVELVCSFFHEERIGREELLVREGGKYRKIVFVVSGILRVFVIDNQGNEVVKNFVEAGHFFSDIDSFDYNQPSALNVAAITDCNLLTLTHHDSDQLIGKLPRWELLLKAGATEAMNRMIRNQEFLRLGGAEEQYLHFIHHFPDLARQVPLKYIASYLRVTQSSLSRIRRKCWQ